MSDEERTRQFTPVSVANSASFRFPSADPAHCPMSHVSAKGLPASSLSLKQEPEVLPRCRTCFTVFCTGCVPGC